MNLKFETKLDYFIFFIVFIKIIFILSAFSHVILHYSIKHNSKNVEKKIKIDEKLVYFKELTEFIFIISMSILLIYHFNPNYSRKPISKETSLLFFLFGFILIITSKWSLIVPSRFLKK
jgi:hypothetical protein